MARFKTLEDFPGFVAARGRAQKALEALDSAQAEYKRLIVELHQATRTQTHGVRYVDADRARTAAAAIAAAPRPVGEAKEAKEARLVELDKELPKLNAARHAAQAERAKQLEAATQAMSDERAPAHSAIIKRMAAAVRALSAVVIEERAFIQRAQDDGLNLASFAFPGVGDHRTPQSPAALYLATVRRVGLLVEDAAMAAE